MKSGWGGRGGRYREPAGGGAVSMDSRFRRRESDVGGDGGGGYECEDEGRGYGG